MPIVIRKDSDNYDSSDAKAALKAMGEIDRMNIALTRMRDNITHSGYLLNTFGNVRRTTNVYQRIQDAGVTNQQLAAALQDRYNTDWSVEGASIANLFTVTVPAIRAWFLAHQEDIMRLQDEGSLGDFNIDTGRSLPLDLQAELTTLLNAALADY